MWVDLFKSLFWNSIWSGRFRDLFPLDLKIVNDDLSVFNVNLLALNQDDNWFIMILAVSIMFSIDLLWKKMVVSSAKILTLPEGQHINKSLNNNRKSSGSSTKP